MRWTGHVGSTGHAGVSWGNVKERDPLDRASCRWDDNIKVDFKVGWK